MRAEYYAILLLLFFSLLYPSCKADEPRYDALAEGGQWERVIQTGSERFAKEGRVDDLYWIARAHYERKQGSLAQRAIDLYFALAYEGEITIEARRLALLLPDSTHAIEQGRILEEQGMMDSSLAAAYYQAFMKAGMESEANRIFVHYLGDTLKPRAYAQLLIRSHADGEATGRALSALEDGEAIALLWEVAQMDLQIDASASLATVAAVYEQHPLTQTDRLLLYAALSRLYAMADMRVLSNKYRSLSQGL